MLAAGYLKRYAALRSETLLRRIRQLMNNMLTGKKTLLLFLLNIALLQILALPQSHAQPGGQVSAEAHFSQGVEHQRAGRFAEAVESEFRWRYGAVAVIASVRLYLPL